MANTSFPRNKMGILFLENIHPIARLNLEQRGYRVEAVGGALSEAELAEAMQEVHILGIRSKTSVPHAVLSQARQLLAIGCFCIGTDQVDLQGAAQLGIPVFNAPFSNTRSVAELTMAEIVMLSRRANQRSMELHRGDWQKSASGCFEVRGKTVGIVGYGNIGPQVGLLAEAFGMSVLFYDINRKLPLGNAQPVSSLKELLEQSDFVTLHVPDTEMTRGMIGSEELACMKAGSYLLNLSRGRVVDLDALAEKLKSRSLAGAAVDVFPSEPESNGSNFSSCLMGLENVILTPHIGGSTEEAQQNIGVEVADYLLGFIEEGATSGAVNFPRAELPVSPDQHRVLNIHRNVPGVLGEINQLVAKSGANITAQVLSTNSEIGYMIMDVSPELSRSIKQDIDQLSANIKTRLLF